MGRQCSGSTINAPTNAHNAASNARTTISQRARRAFPSLKLLGGCCAGACRKAGESQLVWLSCVPESQRFDRSTATCDSATIACPRYWAPPPKLRTACPPWPPDPYPGHRVAGGGTLATLGVSASYRSQMVCRSRWASMSGPSPSRTRTAIIRWLPSGISFFAMSGSVGLYSRCFIGHNRGLPRP